MTEKTKKIIAREGLIFLLCMAWAFLIRFTEIPILITLFVDKITGMHNFDFDFIVAFSVVYLLYPLYLLIRFVIWAVKTLKGK
jgi:hypothetical protein